MSFANLAWVEKAPQKRSKVNDELSFVTDMHERLASAPDWRDLSISTKASTSHIDLFAILTVAGYFFASALLAGASVFAVLDIEGEGIFIKALGSIVMLLMGVGRIIESRRGA